MKALLDKINLELERRTDEIDAPKRIKESVKYSLLAGGKRLRPVMLLKSAGMMGGGGETAMAFACALEMIHTYSLIHDDLPVMDNDELRRGKPTNHVLFGEALALLAGDALLNLAYETILNALMHDPSAQAISAAAVIARAAGMNGMIGGQVLDVDGAQEQDEALALKEMHLKKTGALFEAAVLAGAILAGAKEEEIALLREYAHNFGMVFQITDDILDVTGDVKVLGKSIGKDEAANKVTYVSVYGLERARELAIEHVHKANDCLDKLQADSSYFKQLIQGLIDRDR